MYQPSTETIALLEDLERRIDPQVEEDFLSQWRSFLNGKFTGEIFTPKRKTVTQPGVELTPININDAIADYELMLYSQLAGAARALSSPSGLPTVRSNYGTGIMTSLFGAEVFVMPRETNTLPTTRSFNDTDKIREIMMKGKPDLMTGFGRNVFEMGEIFAEVLAKYPKVQQYVHVYHPDTQGPLDICELLWGGEIFYSMYDEPDFVGDVLTLVTDTYADVLDKWFDMFPCDADMNFHWNLCHWGRILLRCDSAMNLSPEFYREFAKPYDARLLAHFGGGAMHFCGRGDHYIADLTSTPGLTGINMSQPELNDMEIIYQNTVDKGIPILSFPRHAAEAHASRPGGFRSLVHID
ncbi:MAG: hypothetical protein IJN58_02610 [Clostridia bacterium]|nr:hypothetical protein [Clostridia bacterium]